MACHYLLRRARPRLCFSALILQKSFSSLHRSFNNSLSSGLSFVHRDRPCLLRSPPFRTEIVLFSPRPVSFNSQRRLTHLPPAFSLLSRSRCNVHAGILHSVLVEFVLISMTSAVKVTIACVVKEALIITVAVFYFHDEFTWLKGVGLLMIILGVSLFN